MEMDVSNLRLRQTNAYTKTGAVSAKTETAETAEASGAASANAEAATFRADGGRSYNSAMREGFTVDTETIERLKSESEQRMANLVQQMLGKQINQVNMLDAIQAGRFSAEDIEQAKKDTADDGYWGVEQTSDRFVQYATALTGGDPDKLDAMIEAFEKGYAEAEKQWGGELPELSQKTREATLKKFQDLKDQYAQKNGATASAAAQNVLADKVQEALAKS